MLERLFDFISQYINGEGIFTRKHYQWELKKLRKQYGRLDLEEPVGPPNNELDTENIIFKNTDSIISLTWDIDKLWKYIKEYSPTGFVKVPIEAIQYNMGPSEFAVMMESVSLEPEIQNNTFSFKKEPILLIQLPFTGQLYILDGKHRLFEAYRKSKLEIEAYIFDSGQLVSFLYDDNQRRKYQFVCDLFAFLEKTGMYRV